mgnify:CR=1 FL=1
MIPPPLTVQVSSGPEYPQWRGISPSIILGGWLNYLGSIHATCLLYGIREVFLMGCFGDDFARYPNGQYAKYKDSGGIWRYVRRQNILSYANAKGTVPDNATNTDAFREGIQRLRSSDIRVYAYVGPWVEPSPPTNDLLSDALSPYLDCDIVFVDGSGASDQSPLFNAIPNHIHGIEPLASLNSPHFYTTLPSFTLTQSIRSLDSFYFLDEYRGTRYLLENDRSEHDPDYWPRFDAFTSQGFRMCLPHIHSIWDTWLSRYGTTVEGGSNVT